MVSALVAKSLEHTKYITQLNLDNQHLWSDRESVRQNLESLKRENENLRIDNKNFRQVLEDLRLDSETLKSQLREYLQQRDEEMKQFRGTTADRFHLIEAITVQISEFQKRSKLRQTRMILTCEPCVTAPRTCQTLAELGVNRTGVYLVDPDGALFGDPPVQVFCDMKTGLFALTTVDNTW